MRNLSIGIMLGILTCMVILSFYPLTETDQACSACGMKAWYFKVAEGGE